MVSLISSFVDVVRSAVKGTDYFATKLGGGAVSHLTSSAVCFFSGKEILEWIQADGSTKATANLQTVIITYTGATYALTLVNGFAIRIIRRQCGCCGCGSCICGVPKQALKFWTEVIHGATDVLGGCIPFAAVWYVSGSLGQELVDWVGNTPGSETTWTEIAENVAALAFVTGLATTTGLCLGAAFRTLGRKCVKKPVDLPIPLPNVV